MEVRGTTWISGYWITTVQENEDVEKILKAVDTDGVARQVAKTTVCPMARSNRYYKGLRLSWSRWSEREAEVGFNYN